MTATTKKEVYYIGKLREQIEAQLGWGDPADWSSRNFEALSERIFEATGTQLSHTTLKRIWGRVRYTANPSDTTLDTLAQFAGYESWLLFKQAERRVPSTAITSGNKRSFRWPLSLKIGIPVLVLGLLLAFFWPQSDVPFSEADLENVQFSVRKITEGLPNTVVFDYDVAGLSAERIQIQQKWDERKRVEVEKGQTQAAVTYFYPGYFNAKLVLDGQIVRTQDLYIQSNGWLVAIEDEPQPQYILDKELLQNGQLAVDSTVLALANREEPKTLSYFYLTDFHVPTGAFTLETAFRNTWRSGQSVCQNSRVLITGTEGCINLPFAIPGCTGALNLFLNGTYVYGDRTDLSAFGCDFQDFEHLKVEVADDFMQVWLNEKLIYENAIDADFGELVGVKYSFLGAGEVDFVRYRDAAGQVFFEEAF